MTGARALVLILTNGGCIFWIAIGGLKYAQSRSGSNTAKVTVELTGGLHGRAAAKEAPSRGWALAYL